MNIKRYICEPFLVNSYLIYYENHGIMIDPGENALSLAIKEGFLIEKILITHGHFDHIAGLSNDINIPIYIHKNDGEKLKDKYKNLSVFCGYNISFDIKPKYINSIENNDTIEFYDIKLKVIHSPGHCEGLCVFYNEKDSILFSGDLIFENGIGRTDFPTSNEEDMKKSLENILKLPLHTLIYPGHGESFYLKDFSI